MTARRSRARSYPSHRCTDGYLDAVASNDQPSVRRGAATAATPSTAATATSFQISNLPYEVLVNASHEPT